MAILAVMIAIVDNTNKHYIHHDQAAPVPDNLLARSQF